MGNLLVNFSRDQDIHDEALPDALHYAGIYGLILLATTITVSTQIELFSVMSGGLFVVTGLMLFAYLPTATQLKHLRNDTAGQLVTLVAEALEGLTVIQAFDKQVQPPPSLLSAASPSESMCPPPLPLDSIFKK